MKQAALPVNSTLYLFLLLVFTEKPRYLSVTQHLNMSGGLRSHPLSSHAQSSTPCTAAAASSCTAAPAARIWVFCLFYPRFCFFSAHKKDGKKEKGKRKTEKGKRKKEKRRNESSTVSSKSKCNSLSSWEWRPNFVSRLGHFLRANQQTSAHLRN